MSAYVLMVSHGGFAEGLCDTLHMFAGNSEGIMSIGLRDGESVEGFRLRAQTLIAQLDQQDELLVLADLIGGSPLTTVLDVLQEKGMLTNTAVLGGMHLAMALNAVLCKDQGIREMKQMILQEATASITEMTLQNEEEEDI